MPIATFVTVYQYYSFSAKTFVHIFQKKTNISKSSQKHENCSNLLQIDFALVSYALKRNNRFFVSRVNDVHVKC
jgi:hypothetical protein